MGNWSEEEVTVYVQIEVSKSICQKKKEREHSNMSVLSFSTLTKKCDCCILASIFAGAIVREAGAAQCGQERHDPGAH